MITSHLMCVMKQLSYDKNIMFERKKTATEKPSRNILHKFCRNSCSQILLKIGVLKNFTIFTGTHWSHWSPSFTEHLPWICATANSFFQLNLVFIADIRTGFCSELLSKQELSLRSSHWNSYVKKVFLAILQIS